MPHSLNSLVGNTPLVRLQRVIPQDISPAVSLFAKLEQYNPSGSVKARAAARILQEAEDRGLLKQGMTILDASSGNTGIAYAMFAAQRGYTLKLCLPKNANQERKNLLRAFGANLIYTSPLEGSDGAIQKARQLAKENPDWFYCDQYSNDANWRAHYFGTGPEIWRQTDGAVTHLVSSLGTSGTFMGCTRFLKEKNPTIQCISVEPDTPFHGLEGMKHMESAMVPAIYNPALADKRVEVETEEVYGWVQRLAKNEGLLVGPSCAAAFCAAINLAKDLKKANIVIIFPDSGERYLSDEHIWSTS